MTFKILLGSITEISCVGLPYRFVNWDVFVLKGEQSNFLFALLKTTIYQGENWISLQVRTEYVIVKLYKFTVVTNLAEMQESNTALSYKYTYLCLD